MKMKSDKRAIDKIYKRRNRYDIPDWQRQEVWGKSKKQNLIDSVLKGWKLPKFYFLKTNDNPEEYEVVDGQQRLSAIFEFFDNELPLSPATSEKLGATYYRELKDDVSDDFDDFEIEYDLIEEADEDEVKEFFQRLQEGLPLTSAEKLNSVHSNLRDFSSSLSKRKFFREIISVSDKRHGHFDIAAKAACIEVDGVEVGLRFDDMQPVFESQRNFSDSSEVAIRLTRAVDFLEQALKSENVRLRNRSIVQSLISLSCKVVSSNKHQGLEGSFKSFVEFFLDELSSQVEKGQKATDKDYLEFQKTISANTKVGPRIRHGVLVRKLLSNYPEFSVCFGIGDLSEAGISNGIKLVGQEIAEKVSKINEIYSSIHGVDLFKPTNKTVVSMQVMAKPIESYSQYKELVECLYFLFHEGPGGKLNDSTPESFKDINKLRTNLQHDLDHGKASKVAKKKKDIGDTFKKYSGYESPELLDDEAFSVVQANILNSINSDINALILEIKA